MVAVMVHDAEYREEVENSAKEIIEKKRWGSDEG
jgi:hypothetical protein